MRDLTLAISRTGRAIAPTAAAVALASFAVVHCAAASATRSDATVSRAAFLMGTACEITVPAASAPSIEAAFSEIGRIETHVSTWRPASELSRLNAAPLNEPVPLSPELVELIEESMRWARETGGAFNPLVGEAIAAWQTRGAGAVPDETVIAAAAASARFGNLELDRAAGVAVKRAVTRFEEGGFGKGYALDRAVAVLEAKGVASAILNFGGQIATFGGGKHRVVIADPDSRETPAVEVTIGEGSLSTSSGSEKSFEVGGRRFSHIIDPRSGEALSPSGSVSVFDRSAMTADVLSTALYVMGPTDGLRWADEHGVAALYLTPSADGFQITTSTAMRRMTPVRPLNARFEKGRSPQ
jgi:FAD:protein FMN transferase